MVKYGLSTIFTLILLVASVVILVQYQTSSMSATAQGVNLTDNPYNDSYQATTHTTITAISVSHYTVLLLAITSVLIALVILIDMAIANRRKGI